ncbi:outer envelope protein [Undibacterium sp.]|uniref:outer envelope protein n=1 Tax=Undibacterium sp. TaxID=1914977 RepID=UPI0037528E33
MARLQKRRVHLSGHDFLSSLHFSCISLLSLFLLFFTVPVLAEDWSDTSISLRTGSKFAEPYNPKSVAKNIWALSHAGGTQYGSQFFNVDFLQSDKSDPASGGGGAQEAYVVYRNTFDLGKISGTPMTFGPIKGVGVTLGFDWNTKNDISYQSKKRMLVIGPTLMLDVPGWMSIDLLLLSESNFPAGIANRYSYKTHLALGAEWGIPLGNLGAVPFSFEGFGLIIASKGRNEFGGNTAPETNFDMNVMADTSDFFGARKKTFRVGVAYQYWKNKFGTPASVPGSIAKTWMIRLDHHF